MWEAGPEAVHVFSGLRAYPAVYNAFLQCVKKKRRAGLVTECPARRGPRSIAARLVGKVDRLRIRASHEFVLGVGENAPLWFGRLGYETGLLFEFAYYPPLPPAGERPADDIWPSGPVRLLFIGQLNHRKGIDSALRALREASTDAWVLGLVEQVGRKPILSNWRRIWVSGRK